MFTDSFTAESDEAYSLADVIGASSTSHFVEKVRRTSGNNVPCCAAERESGKRLSAENSTPVVKHEPRDVCCISSPAERY